MTRGANEPVDFPRVPWEEFRHGFTIKQGQHTTVIKPTGGGKTTLIASILPAHPVQTVVVFVTKTYDETFRREFAGWKRIEEWPPPRYVDRVLLWPRLPRGRAREKFTIRAYKAVQRRVFRQALNRIAIERGWTIVCDEEHYLCEELGLYEEVAWVHHQGRSSGITGLTGIQRPKFVPRVTYSSATHAFLGYTVDRDDLKDLAAFGGAVPGGARSLEYNLGKLGEFDFCYVPVRVTGRTPAIVNVKR